MTNQKERTKQALEKYLTKISETQNVLPIRKNKAPESKVITNELLPWCMAHDMIIYRYESKAVKNYKTNSFIRGNVVRGHSDLAGFLPDGRAVYIEAKAPGKRATISYDQREFLRAAISGNCFAVVTDGVMHLQKIYLLWVASGKNPEVLLMDLPKKSELRGNDPLFE